MTTFRIDATNYGECARGGVRIVPGAGFKADFAEFAADSFTFGLWHLHNGGCEGEGTGLEDASNGGHTLTNHGATAGEYGYQFVRNETNYMDAPFQGQPAQSQVTLEAWVQAWGVTAGSGGYIAQYRRDSINYLSVWAYRGGTPSASFIRATLYIQTVTYNASWSGADADAILASGQAWHVAGVLDAPGSLRLFVNGTLQASQSSVPSLPAGNWTLYLGRLAGSIAFNLSAIVDEVRLSSTARYAATFLIGRLVAAGTCTSPTFDGVRSGVAWSDLTSAHALPAGTGLAWEVRAADSTDAGGPLAAWQPYDGDPSGLPQGRYFQWRATLSSSPDRLASPTLESIDALTSNAGYNVYHATGNSPELLDYGEPWACVCPGATQLEVGPLDAGAVHWFSVRPVDGRDVESPLAQGELRLELDNQGQQVPDRPAGVLALSARPLPGGCAQLEWSYRVGQAGVLPQVFRIFGDGGSGTINYAAPLGETAYRPSESSCRWTSGQLAGGAAQQLAVRAITAGGVWDEQPAVASVTCDPTAPGEVDNLTAEVIL
jgi:hypothetical protein